MVWPRSTDVVIGSRVQVEYSALIAEVERIKSEMGTVQKKVDRSMALLGNLSSENDRWEADSKGFQQQMSTVVGDALLSGTAAAAAAASAQLTMGPCSLLLLLFVFFCSCFPCVHRLLQPAVPFDAG